MCVRMWALVSRNKGSYSVLALEARIWHCTDQEQHLVPFLWPRTFALGQLGQEDQNGQEQPEQQEGWERTDCHTSLFPGF